MVCPSKSGIAWLCIKMIPHKNAVNHMLVNLFGWYFRMTAKSQNNDIIRNNEQRPDLVPIG
jgi:hypothetical protein